jgi:circadian clock protein KaiC
MMPTKKRDKRMNKIKSKKKIKINKNKFKKIKKESVPDIKLKQKTVKTNKPKKVLRISSGIKKFDSLVGGGFEKNSTNLLVGSSGSGKSIFAIQFLIEGIKKGEKCLFITFEEKKQEFYENMLELGFDLEKLEKQEKFFFLEYTPQKVKAMLDEGGGSIETIVLTKKITRIAIDSITSFIMLFENGLEQKEAALSLFSLIRGWNCTSLLTFDGEPIPGEKSSRIIDLESDSIILFYFLRREKERKRYIEILKMRGTHHSLNLYEFSIDKNGISISKTPAKFEASKSK